MAGNSCFLGNLPILDGKNWGRWNIQMKVIFWFQDVLEIVQAGYPELGDSPTNAQKVAYKDAMKHDSKALFLIH